MTTGLNLREVHPAFIEQAVQGFEDGDVGSFLMSTGGRGSQLGLVADNFPMLKKRGIYEECLLWAFTGTRWNSHKWSPSVLKFLFDYADKQKLRDAGETIPNQPIFQIYRGIAGDKHRRPSGYSWTLSLDVACWFATRFDLPKPSVLVSEILRDDILAYVGDRGEGELICRPTTKKFMKLTLEEIGAGARRHQQAIERKNRMSVESIKRKTSSAVANA
jgi:hypothetical protein